MKILELGGGDNPQPGVTCNVDVRPGPNVNFIANFEEPLPISSDEWDRVISVYVIEHMSWRKLPLFLAEMFRVLKPGGTVHLVTANTEAQLKWVLNLQEKEPRKFYERASCILFGDQDYPENTHRLYLSPLLFKNLLEQVGFQGITIKVVGSEQTDMMAEAVKPDFTPIVSGQVETAEIKVPATKRFVRQDPDGKMVQSDGELGPWEPVPDTKVFAQVRSPESATPTPISVEIKTPPPSVHDIKAVWAPEQGVKASPEKLYDFAYFNGGSKVGGYAREGYWDFPVHEITARQILSLKPSSVLEVGCARGYVLKRIQDAGAVGVGLEVSKHCFMTRVADGIVRQDILKFPWKIKDNAVDLIYSVAFLEHIPEEALPDLIKEMARVSQRCIHGVDFGEKDDGFDKTHCTLKPKEFWQELFFKYYSGGGRVLPYEILDKEDMEKGSLPEDYLKGDGKTKLNIGCATTMFHHGWRNIDVLDLKEFAKFYGYLYAQHDVRNGFAQENTQTVDCLFLCHFLEHLTYDEGVKFLRECRRIIKPDGAMRIIVPDTLMLTGMYMDDPKKLIEFDEINVGCKKHSTAAGKLWSLLHEGHQMGYDEIALAAALDESGWRAQKQTFRQGHSQILAETLDMLPCLSLYMDAYPT